jgi:hypothetical protein
MNLAELIIVILILLGLLGLTIRVEKIEDKLRNKLDK